MNKIADLDARLKANEKEKQDLINLLGEKQRENEILNSKLKLTEQLKDKEISDMMRKLEKDQVMLIKS